jgi:hypothetical protein
MAVAFFCAALITFIASLKVIMGRLQKEEIALRGSAKTKYACFRAKVIARVANICTCRLFAGMDSQPCGRHGREYDCCLATNGTLNGRLRLVLKRHLEISWRVSAA